MVRYLYGTVRSVRYGTVPYRYRERTVSSSAIIRGPAFEKSQIFLNILYRTVRDGMGPYGTVRYDIVPVLYRTVRYHTVRYIIRHLLIGARRSLLEVGDFVEGP